MILNGFGKCIGKAQALKFANSKAVSIEAIKKEIYQWRARHFNNPKEQADDLDSRLNNLTK